MKFTAGQAVKIPCAIGPGAFSGESLVTIEVEGERVTGFVKREFLLDDAVLGTIVEVGPDSVTMKVPGSFFTRASGRTTVPFGWANAHLQPAPA